MKPDLIITWPRNVEYPLFRQFVRDSRSNFGKVIIVFTSSGSEIDYSQFVINAMSNDDCIFLSSSPILPGEDWRNVAIQDALKLTTSDWLWFMEQDFLVTDPAFWDEINEYITYREVIGVKENSGRLHPCCLLIRRDTLNRTGCDFGIVQDQMDHFGLIQSDLEALDVFITGLTPKYYHHMNGLSHNFHLASTMQEVTYYPDEFKRYLSGCLTLTGVPLDPRFEKVAKSMLLQ